MVLRLLATLLVLAAAPVALAGTVEDRAGALTRSETRAADLDRRIGGLTADLEQVARRIEALKAEDLREAAVVPDRELTELLRHSQELADLLSALGRERDQAEAARRGAAAQLVDACEAEIDRLRAAVAGGDRAALQRSTSLDDLRTRARAYLSRSLPSSPAASGYSDDPAELRERADLLRDQRDRVLSRLSDVDARVLELRDRARLERAMGSFRREESLFDEASRVQRITTSRPAAQARPANDGAGAEGDPAASELGTTFADTDGGSRLPDVPGGSTTPPELPSATTPAPVAGTTSVSSAIPRFGGDPRVGSFLAPLSGRESLPDLQAAREALQREAKELERRASEMERRARSLEQGE